MAFRKPESQRQHADAISVRATAVDDRIENFAAIAQVLFWHMTDAPRCPAYVGSCGQRRH
jgi:hypothetical protein